MVHRIILMLLLINSTSVWSMLTPRRVSFDDTPHIYSIIKIRQLAALYDHRERIRADIKEIDEYIQLSRSRMIGARGTSLEKYREMLLYYERQRHSLNLKLQRITKATSLSGQK